MEERNNCSPSIDHNYGRPAEVGTPSIDHNYDRPAEEFTPHTCEAQPDDASGIQPR